MRTVMPLTSPSLDALRNRFLKLVEPFETHPDYKRFATTPTHDGGPHIEKHGSIYAWVVTERGHEHERRETDDPDDVLYWLVCGVTTRVAQDYELQNREPTVDSRRMWFNLNVELLRDIKAEWGARKRAEYDRILRDHPFSDGA